MTPHTIENLASPLDSALGADDHSLASLFRTALAPTPESGPTVGGYTLIEELGQGGSAVVWLAVKEGLGQEVALKIYRGEESKRWGDSAKWQARFHREIEIVSKLDHPYVAKVLDSGQADGALFLVMELVQGKPLDDHVEDAKLTTRDVVELTRKVAEGLAHAHRRGVIHRDLKPSNVLVTEAGHPKILDFGLAKALDSDLGGAAWATVSMDGELLGTPAFMAPEQAAGRVDSLDTRTDVYALGAVLYRLLTGRLPHDFGGTKIEALRRVAEDEVAPPSAWNRTLRGDLEALLLKSMARDPNDRYASASELADDLGRYLHGEPLLARRRTVAYFLAKHVRRHLGAWLLSALALAAAALGVISYTFKLRSFARTESRLRSDLAVEVGESYLRRASEAFVDNRTDDALALAARALREDRGNRAAAVLAGFALRQSAHLIPLDCLPRYADAPVVDVAFATRARVHAVVGGKRAQVFGENGQALSPKLALPDCGENACLSDDGKLLLVKCEGAIRLFDGDASWRDAGSIQPKLLSTFTDVIASPDRKWIGLVESNGEARLWDWRANRVVSVKMPRPEDVPAGSDARKRIEALAGLKFERVVFDPPSRHALFPLGDKGFLLWSLQRQAPVYVGDDESSAFMPPAKRAYSFDQTGQRLLTVQPGKAWVNYYILPSGELDLASTLPPREIFNNQGLGWAEFSRDGRQILVAGHKMVALHDVEGGDVVSLTPPNLRWARQAAISPDGKLVGAIGDDAPLHLWDLETRASVGVTPRHGAGLHVFAFDQSGNRLASVDMLGRLFVWDWRTGEKLAITNARLRGLDSTSRLRFSPDDRHVVADQDGAEKAWLLRQASMSPRIIAENEPLVSATLSPDGKYVLGATKDQARLWDVSTGQATIPWLRHVSSDRGERWYGMRTEAVFAPDSRGFLLCPAPDQAQMFGLDGRPLGPARSLYTKFPGLLIGPGRGDFACAVSVTAVQVWNPRAGREIAKFKPEGEVFHGLLSPSGQKCLLANHLREVQLWDPLTGKRLFSQAAHHLKITSMAWSPDETRFATASRDTRIRVFSVGKLTEETSFSHARAVREIHFHPTAPLLLSCAEDGVAMLWDLRQARAAGTPMKHRLPLISCAFSPDGSLLATVREDGSVFLWDTSTQQLLNQAFVHPAPISKIQFHSAGDQLLTLCDDGKARLWPIFRPDGPAPAWFPEFLEALSGSREDAAETVNQARSHFTRDPFSDLAREVLGEAKPES